MNRRKAIQTSLASLVGVLTGGMLGKTLAKKPEDTCAPDVKVYSVTTQEFDGREVTRWQFKEQDAAEKFVRSLYPRLEEVSILKYRTDVHTMKVSIVSTATERYGFLPKAIEHKRFWNLDAAWMYLFGIRINGKPVARPVNQTGYGLSDYEVQKFVKNPNMKIVDLTGTDIQMDPTTNQDEAQASRPATEAARARI